MCFLLAAPAFCLATGAGVAILLSESGTFHREGCYLGVSGIIILQGYFLKTRFSSPSQLFFFGLLTGWGSADLHFRIPGNLSLESDIGSNPCWAEFQGIIYPSDKENVLLLDVKNWRRRSQEEWRQVNVRVRISGPFEQAWNPRQYCIHKVETSGLIRPVFKDISLIKDKATARDLRRVGVVYDLALAEWEDLVLIETSKLTFWSRLKIQTSQWLIQRRTWASQVLGHGIEVRQHNDVEVAPIIEMIRAMALGERERLDDETKELFQQTGVYHAFAISGLHITIITGLGALIFQAFRFPNKTWVHGMALFTWAYIALTGWQPSAIRAAIFWGVAISSILFQRPYRGMNTLGCAAFLMLIWDPSSLFDPGFHLSFLVTASLLIWLPRWNVSPSSGDLFSECRPPLFGFLRKIRNWILIYLCFQLAAGIGSTPLLMQFFHIISPASLLSNLIIFPCVTILLSSITSSLLLASLGLPGVEWMNHTAWLTMKLLVEWCQWIGSMDWASFQVASPGLGFLVVWYFWMVWGWSDSGWKWINLHPWMHFCLCGFLLLASYRSEHLHKGELRLFIFNCSAGDGIWMDFPGESNDRMIDGCRKNSWYREALPLLTSKGINVIPSWVFTHGDIAHYEVGAENWEDWQTRNFVFPNANHRSTVYRKFQNNITALSEEAGSEIEVRQLRANDWIGPGVRVLSPMILDPEEYKTISADFSPLALYIEPKSNQAGAGILILSDMSGMAQSKFLERYSDLKVDVIIASSNSDMSHLKTNLIRTFHPDWIILNSGGYPAYQATPDSVKLRILKAAGISRVYDTQETGSLELEIRNGKLQIHPVD